MGFFFKNKTITQEERINGYAQIIIEVVAHSSELSDGFLKSISGNINTVEVNCFLIYRSWTCLIKKLGRKDADSIMDAMLSAIHHNLQAAKDENSIVNVIAQRLNEYKDIVYKQELVVQEAEDRDYRLVA